MKNKLNAEYNAFILHLNFIQCFIMDQYIHLFNHLRGNLVQDFHLNHIVQEHLCTYLLEIPFPSIFTLYHQ